MSASLKSATGAPVRQYTETFMRGMIAAAGLSLAALMLASAPLDAQQLLSPLNPVVDQGSTLVLGHTESANCTGFAGANEWTYTVTGANGGTNTGLFGYASPQDGFSNCIYMDLAIPYIPGSYQYSLFKNNNFVASTTITVNPITITINGPQVMPQFTAATFTVTVTGIVYNPYNGTNNVAWSVTPTGDFQYYQSDTSSLTINPGDGPANYIIRATSTFETSVVGILALTILPPPVTTISPTSALIGAGQGLDFTSSVVNAPNQNVTWYTNDPDGSVNPYGDGTAAQYVHQPGKPGGTFYVQAESDDGGNPARAQITIVSVLMAPSAITVIPGTSRQFVAEVTGSNQSIQWSTTIPGATVANGLLQVPSGTAASSYTVTAETVGSPLVASAAVVTVASSIPVSAVIVSPARSIIDSGQQEPFAALVEDQYAEPHPNQTVSWSVSGPAAATVATNGMFTAPATPGVYTVTAVAAADATKSGSAAVVVGENLMVLPSSASLAPGTSLQLHASVSGVTSPSVAWSIEEGASGGTVSAAGLYTAPAASGVYHVVAVSSAGGESVQGLATLVVTSAAPISIAVSPVDATLTAGATQQFSAAVSGASDTAVIWSASAGSIDGTGLFTAPAGYGTVTITATSHAAPQVKATATAVIAAAGQGQAFQYDANGNLLADGTRTYEWDAENRLTAVNIGTHRSEFTYDGFGRRVLITEKDSGAVSSSRHYIWIGDQMVEETDAKTAPTGTLGSGGSFDTISCNQLAGWAWSSATPNTPITVDIYDGSTKIATTLANAFRADLHIAGAGNGNHAFFFPTPAALKTGTQHSVTVDIGGTTTALGTRTITCSAPTFGGFLDTVSCSQIAGWAWDANQPNSPINVDLYDGTTLIATVTASNFRQDLLNAGKGNGNHGFAVPTPPSLKTGGAHAITAKFSGTSTVIGGPTSLTCTAPSFNGSFDAADCMLLQGWAWDASQPNAGISVDIYDGSILLATVTANTFRQDLLNAGLGNGSHAFSYSSPALYTGATHSLTIKYGGTTSSLPLGPRSVTCPAETIVTRFFPQGMQTAGNPYYFTYDHLGSIREVTSAGGTAVDRYDYDPYGRQIVNQGAPIELGFAGYYNHVPSGLDLTKYRAYDPDLGRWESRDPAQLQGANPYWYANNDPIDLFDRRGDTAIKGPPNTWQWNPPDPNNPNGGQWRLFGPDGNAAWDEDWGHTWHHPTTPHGHTWDWSDPEHPDRSGPVDVPNPKPRPADPLTPTTCKKMEQASPDLWKILQIYTAMVTTPNMRALDRIAHWIDSLPTEIQNSSPPPYPVIPLPLFWLFAVP